MGCQFGADLEAARASFAKLGFRLTARSMHAGALQPGGPVHRGIGWYDDQLVVAAYIGGDGQSAELVVEWLQVVLPTVVENLAAVDPTTIGFDRTSV